MAPRQPPPSVDPKAAVAAWDRAHRGGDAGAVRRLLATTFLSLSDKRLDTEAYLDAHFGGRLQIETYRTEIETLRAHGDTVVLSGRLHLAGRRDGEFVVGTRLVSQTWTRSDDRWAIALLHSSSGAVSVDHRAAGHDTATPTEVFRRVLAGMVGAERYDLTPLYAPDVVLRHPFNHPRPALIHGRGTVQNLADNLREHFEMTASNVVVHETDDPEVVIATWDYRTRARETGREVDTSNVSIMRVRAGRVVSSSDYHDHAALAELLGPATQLDNAADAVGGDTSTAATP